MIEIQTWDLWKAIQCDNNLGLLIVCFHLLPFVNIVVINNGNDEQIFNIFKIILDVIYLQLNLNSTQLIANSILINFNSIQLNLINLIEFELKSIKFGAK